MEDYTKRPVVMQVTMRDLVVGKSVIDAILVG
jgi:hypothetical protein